MAILDQGNTELALDQDETPDRQQASAFPTARLTGVVLRDVLANVFTGITDL